MNDLKEYTIRRYGNKWKVSIPDQNDCLTVNYSKLNFWQRLWMRFMGWKVEKVGE